MLPNFCISFMLIFLLISIDPPAVIRPRISFIAIVPENKETHHQWCPNFRLRSSRGAMRRCMCIRHSQIVSRYSSSLTCRLRSSSFCMTLMVCGAVSFLIPSVLDAPAQAAYPTRAHSISKLPRPCPRLVESAVVAHVLCSTPADIPAIFS